VNILFVCTMNCGRSPTAEKLFSNNQTHVARSAGTHIKARRRLTQGKIRWASLVVVFEKCHEKVVRRIYPWEKTVICLDIPDKFKYMSNDLVNTIKARLYHQTNILLS
jgi:predicted protein tyrosine phosphatase